jgi:hypothetical protein
MRLGPSGITPEARFVTLCVREPETVTQPEVHSAAAAVDDWDRVVRIADRHFVIDYVLKATNRWTVELPIAALQGLRERQLLRVAHRMLIDAELVRILGVLAAADLPLVLLKGPVLARTIYPEPQLRGYNDIDMVVEDANKDAVVAKLLGCGFTEVPCSAKERNGAHAAHLENGSGFHREFVTRGGQVLVELHADALQLGLKANGESQRWQRARPVPALPGALMLGAEDQIVQLSSHAHKHGFSRLIWLKDLDLLVRTQMKPIDWGLVVYAARLEGVQSSVWYSLLLCETMLGTRLPGALLEQLDPGAALRLLYGAVWPVSRITNLNGHMHRRAVQLHPYELWRGLLPNLVLMPRRQERAKAVLRSMRHRGGERA